jgi:hypothetical protein
MTTIDVTQPVPDAATLAGRNKSQVDYVYFDMSIDGKAAGRIEMLLNTGVAPKT